MQEYQNAIETHTLPFSKGIKLNADDLLRKEVIMQLMSNFKLDFKSIETRFHINFKDYFKDALEALRELEEAGLIIIDNDRIVANQTGTLLIRNIAMPFDAYLKHLANQKVFSKTI